MTATETEAAHEATAADLQARYEHEIEQAYLRGYRDRAAGLPLDPEMAPRIDLIRAVEEVVSATDAPFFPGRASVKVFDGHGRPWFFHRADHTIRPDYPTAIRIEANRPLGDAELARLAHLVAYTYAATVRGGTLGKPRRDSAYSFVVAADTSTSKRTWPMNALTEFEMDLDSWLLDGSPVRKTDKAGSGTAGTRAVDGLGDPTLRVAVYYDRTRTERS